MEVEKNQLVHQLLKFETYLDKFFGAGTPPLVIARGGFSVIFPDSSDIAYIFAVRTGLKNLIAWCDLQLTKDNQGSASQTSSLKMLPTLVVFFKIKVRLTQLMVYQPRLILLWIIP